MQHRLIIFILNTTDSKTSNQESCSPTYQTIYLFSHATINQKQENLKITCRPMNDEQINMIIKSLENTDWNSITNDNDINSTYDKLITKLHVWDTVNEYAPEQNITINKNKIIRQPWMTSGLLQSINTRHKLLRKSIGKPRNSTTYQSYIKYRNILNSLKRTTKQNYYGNLLTEYTCKYDIRKT